MGEQENVVQFNTVLDVAHHRFILDFLSGIDLENSMAYLPVTIHDPCISQDEYVHYLFSYIEAELTYLIDEIAHSDPKIWKRHHQLLEEQIKDKNGLIRFCLRLTGSEVDPDIEIHELVLIWDHYSKSYVLTQYNYNHESLVSVATFDYLNPDIEVEPSYESPMTLVKQ